MSKTDKKIISILLLLIMVVAQLSSVFAAEYTIEDEKTNKTLVQHLIDCGVDSDGNGELSESEWATVKNLELVVDEITTDGIENAVNLKSLILEGIDPNKIDFTKLTKLEKLHIDFYGYNYTEAIDIVLPELKQLKELTINNSYVSSEYFEDEESIVSSTIGKVDISNIQSLEKLNLYRTYPCEITLPRLNSIKEFYISNNNNLQLDLTGATDLIRGEIITVEDLDNIDTLIPNVKLLDNMLVEKSWSKGLKITKLEFKMDLQIGAVLSKGKCSSLKENSIFEIDTNGNIVAKFIGTEEVNIKDILSREHNIEINVFKKDIDTTLGQTVMNVEILDNETILKANGELWKITSDTTAEKLGTNVKKYVSSQVYCQSGGGYAQVEKILKTDDSLELKIDINGTVINENITKVETVSENGINYVKNGSLYEVIINYITENIHTKYIKSNVENIIGDCIITQDGTEYRFSNGKYLKIADFKAIDCYTSYFGIYLLDNNNNEWYYDISTLQLEDIEDSLLDFQEEIYYDIISDYQKEYLHCGDVVTLSDIEYIIRNYDFECEIITRKDGSIWLYSDKSGLTKISKSAEGEKDLVATPIKEKIKTKELGNIKIVTGIPKDKYIGSWVYESAIDMNFEVEVYDLNNEKIYSTINDGTENIGEEDTFKTGMKLVLSSGNVKQEYTIVIYGDTTGDGEIDAFDALTLIKGVNNKVSFKGEEYKEAGRIQATSDEEPTAIDALLIVKSANGKYTINQSK